MLSSVRNLSLLLTVIGCWVSLAVADCTNPSVRKEWRAMTTTERANWVSAVKCLATFPHTDALTPSVDPSLSLIPPVNASGTYYDDFVYIHMDLNIKIHFTGFFFPWHRWYVAVYESALKSRCGYTGASPYWDWTIDAPDFFESSFWSDSSATSGLGGWGQSSLNNDYAVPTGAFDTWYLSYPSPHILRRNFTEQPWLSFAGNPFFPDPAQIANSSFTASEVQKVITGFEGDFQNMQKYVEQTQGMHSNVHLIMGGDLGGTCPENAPANCTPGPTWSANEPLFWLHHGMIDKIWYDWQHASPSNFWSFSGGSVQALDTIEDYEANPNGAAPELSLNSSIPADGLFAESTIYDVMNTTSGLLCYVYE